MKKSLHIKRISILFIALTWLVQSGFGQALLVENFDFPAGSLLTANGWTSHSGAGTQAIDIVIPGLSFTGYPSSNIGGAAQVDNTGEDVNKVFSPVNSGSVYCAFLIKVTTPASGYFFHYGDNPIGTTFRGKVFLDGTGPGFNLGLSKGSNTATLTVGAPYTTGTTYLVVLKYTVISGVTNDEVSLFVIDGAIPVTEPGTPTIGPLQDATQSDLTNVASVAIRQYSATQNLLIDGIRVATTWAGAISDINAPVATFFPSNSATDIAVNITPTITFDEPIRKTDGTSLINSDLATLLTFKKTDASGTNVPFTAIIDAAKKIITVTPSSALDNSQVYYLSIGPVEDEVGNESTLKSVVFNTIAPLAPTITVTYPNGGEKFYSGDLATITWTSTNFDIAENVKIEVWAIDGSTGLYEWIILAESTPNDGQHQVTVGPNAPYGTGYIIKISGVTNGAVDESNAPFTVISTASTLSDLRKYVPGTLIKYTGIATVTYSRTTFNQKYIQDATAAILIHDPTTAPGYITGTYNIGDGITNVEGIITLYSGLIELVPQAATGQTASGTAIVPQIRTLTSLTADDQCKLIKVENLKFDNPNQFDPAGLFQVSKNYDLTGYLNTTYVFRSMFSESDYIGTAIPTQNFNAVVLVGQFNTQMQITARNLADFSVITGVDKTLENSLLIYPVPASDNLNARNIQNVKSIDILDVTGKVVKTFDANNLDEITIPVSNLTRGLYFIKFTTDKGVVIKRFIKS